MKNACFKKKKQIFKFLEMLMAFSGENGTFLGKKHRFSSFWRCCRPLRAKIASFKEEKNILWTKFPVFGFFFLVFLKLWCQNGIFK